MNDIEILGFVAGAFVLISFAFHKILLIRLVSIIAAVLFVAYGVVAEAWSILALNAALIIIHIIYIIVYFVKKEEKKGGA